MRALYSDEEELLRDSIASQVEKLVPTGVADLQRFDDGEIWRRLADGDLLGLGVAEDRGGVGTLLDATIVATALATVVAPVPYLGCAVLPVRLLAAAGASSELIARIVAGELRVAVGFDAGLRGVAQLGRDEGALAWDSAPRLRRVGDRFGPSPRRCGRRRPDSLVRSDPSDPHVRADVRGRPRRSRRAALGRVAARVGRARQW